MNATISVDKAGRVVLPKPMRDALHIRPGSSLEIEYTDDTIVLRTPRPSTELVKKDGMWVVRHSQPLPEPVSDMVRLDRENRIQSFVRGRKAKGRAD